MSPTLTSCQTSYTEQSRRLKTTQILHSYQYTQLRETPCFSLTFQVDQVEMLLLCLLVPLGLAMADTDPRDFARLCDSEECPSGWKKVDAGCILFAGWEGHCDIWPKWHLTKSFLTKWDIWPKSFLTKKSFDQTGIWPKVIWPKVFWPKRTFDQKFFDQKGHLTKNILTKKDSWPKIFWPKGTFDQNTYGRGG